MIRPVLLSFLLLTLIAMAPRKKTKIIFFGDSITQMGINKGGYIDRIQNAINNKELQNKYELVGSGIGGNKVYDLYLRMEEDVLVKKPDRVHLNDSGNQLVADEIMKALPVR